MLFYRQGREHFCHCSPSALFLGTWSSRSTRFSLNAF